jgi:hypothetical protein
LFFIYKKVQTSQTGGQWYSDASPIKYSLDGGSNRGPLKLRGGILAIVPAIDPATILSYRATDCGIHTPSSLLAIGLAKILVFVLDNMLANVLVSVLVTVSNTRPTIGSFTD